MSFSFNKLSNCCVSFVGAMKNTTTYIAGKIFDTTTTFYIQLVTPTSRFKVVICSGGCYYEIISSEKPIIFSHNASIGQLECNLSQCGKLVYSKMNLDGLTIENFGFTNIKNIKEYVITINNYINNFVPIRFPFQSLEITEEKTTFVYNKIRYEIPRLRIDEFSGFNFKPNHHGETYKFVTKNGNTEFYQINGEYEYKTSFLCKNVEGVSVLATVNNQILVAFCHNGSEPNVEIRTFNV